MKWCISICLPVTHKRFANGLRLIIGGLGFREMLEQILASDERDVVKVGVSNISGMYARAILSPQEQKRIVFVGKIEKADYFVTNFRWHPQEYPFPKTFSLMAGDMEIGAVYKITQKPTLDIE